MSRETVLFMQALIKKIKSKDAWIGIIGLGYVGLPLAIEFARKRFYVQGVDLDARKVRALKKGDSYIGDVQSSEVREVVTSKQFVVSEDFQSLDKADVIIICVPTPLRKTKEPDVSYIINAVEHIIALKRKKRLIVLESTTYPGTTEEVICRMLEEAGLQSQKDFLLVFSPERVDPGNPHYKTRDIPKVVGGMNLLSTKAAMALYSNIIKHIIPMSSTRGAEMVKLLENTFRIVNIGLVNELAMMCDKMNINVWEVIDAAATKPFGFMPFYPGPGLGGHCIPIDPLYLSWKAKMYDFEARFIDLAAQINRTMPIHVVTKIMDALNERRKSLKDARIFMLGLAYKKNVNDVRESPAVDILALLQSKGAKVAVHDPFYSDMKVDIPAKHQALTARNLKQADCVLLVTDHSFYKERLDDILKSSSLFIDTRNISGARRGKKIVRL